jgi:hypothetical protein
MTRNFRLKGEVISMPLETKMVFDPGYPYIHLSTANFKSVSNFINNNLGHGNICDSNMCVFPYSCEVVDIGFKDLNFSIGLHDHESGFCYNLTLTQKELLLSEFEGLQDGKCYLPFVS